MIFSIKKKINNFKYYLESNIYLKSHFVYWYSRVQNFGDALTPILLRYITNKRIIKINTHYCEFNHLISLGSVLDRSNSKSLIWGTGFISNDAKWNSAPKKIYAVRGPLTRKKVLKLGKECPEIYGDPALLLPKYYSPIIKKKYQLGIIPHYVDKNNEWLNKIKSIKNVKIIDIQDKNPLNVINNIFECEFICSSSLHGIIVADAYNIPSLWIKFSDLILGGNFKFNDYYLSIGQNPKTPYIIYKTTTINDLLKSFNKYEINLDLDKLLKSFPYL